MADINTGYTQRKPALRGRDTFLPIRRDDQSRRKVQEVAVLEEVSDLSEHLISVEHLT